MEEWDAEVEGAIPCGWFKVVEVEEISGFGEFCTELPLDCESVWEQKHHLNITNSIIYKDREATN